MIQQCYNRRLHGSASTMLTSTAWKCQNWTPHRIETPKPIPIKLSWVILSARRPAVPNLVEIGSWGYVRF